MQDPLQMEGDIQREYVTEWTAYQKNKLYGWI